MCVCLSMETVYSLSSTLPYTTLFTLTFLSHLTYPTLSWPTLPFLIGWYWLVLICTVMYVILVLFFFFFFFFQDDTNANQTWHCCHLAILYCVLNSSCTGALNNKSARRARDVLVPGLTHSTSTPRARRALTLLNAPRVYCSEPDV